MSERLGGTMPERAAATLRAEDEAARLAALDAQHSLLLQAPAGSGKTTVLTARFLTLLAEVQAPEEILAITFTRKAAAEMRERILTALRAAGNGEAPAGLSASLLQRAWRRDRQCGWELLRNPARLRVETIDALNHRLARLLPVSARAAPGLTLARHPAPLYQRAAARALEAAWLEDVSRPAAQLLFERLDNSWKRLQGLLSDMLRHRSHWLPRVMAAAGHGLAERVHESLRSLLTAELAIAYQAIPETLRQEAEALLTHAQRASVTMPVQLTAGRESLPQWRAICRLALTGEGWRRRLTSAEGFERSDVEPKARATAWIEAMAAAGLESTLRTVLALPEERLSVEEEQALDALAQLLMRAAAELQLVFAESGRVDYAYIAGAARASLSEQGEPTDLALRLGTRLRHILVDEFQDTSYEQFGLLQGLTVGWEPGDGRTLFLVGDPMQSIYQFREAEVGLFLRARDHGVGPLTLRPLALRRNFRTQAALLAWINARFAQLFPRQDDPRTAAIAYLPSVPGRESAPAADAGPVTLHRFEVGDRQGEALRVLQIVQQARAHDPHCSVALLVANREHATRIVAVLREAQLPLRGVELEPLRERPVIRDLTALTRALQHRADRTAWLALLRAPWCGLTLTELEGYCSSVHTDHWQALEAACVGEPAVSLQSDRRAALARLCAALRPAMLGAERGLPLWQRVEQCWLRLGGPAVHAEQTARLDAQRFLDALAVHEDPEALVGEALEPELLRALYSGAPPQSDAIEIMTMHAAKGLEWDVVILPGLGRCSARDSDPLLHWLELPRPAGGTELLLSPIRAGTDESDASLASYIKRLRRERRRLERARLLYVAATRARRQLHLLGAVPLAADGTPRPLYGSPLHDLWPAVGEEFAALHPTAVAMPPTAAMLPSLRRMAGSWHMPAPPPAPTPQRLSLPASAVAITPEYRWVGLTARAIGTIVHAELHRLALAGAPSSSAADPSPAVPQLRPAAHYARWLAELGVPGNALGAAGARIARALEGTLADPHGRWLLSHTHPQSHSEWRLTGLHEGRVINVVFDRMLLDARGQRWIVDFKTSSHEGGGMESFLAAEVERYAPQLRRYAALARSLGPEPLRLALYFPLLGAFRELPPIQP